jgi:hypothetical protein
MPWRKLAAAAARPAGDGWSAVSRAAFTPGFPTRAPAAALQANDPFTRAPLEVGQLIPDEELKAKIMAWLQQRRQSAAG